ncbi:MAG: hypothetical protein SFY32_00145 [Bacteroidota bacterium]|nr:hypothetical protein [Bacteroidota bacterium]
MKENLFSCFFQVGFDPTLSEKDFMDLADKFKKYLWDSTHDGIGDSLLKLKHKDYGNDLILVLFQFYVKPTAFELQKLKEIEPYRAKEKAIGVPIIVTDENFFIKSELERFNFLKESISHKMNLLAEVVKKKKLDTNMELLISDVKKILY